MNAETDPAVDAKQETPGPDAPEAGAGGFAGVAESIGTRNLKIAIVAMPLVFIILVAMVIVIFGPPGGRKHAQAPIAAAAPDSAPAATPAAAIGAVRAGAPIALKVGEEIRSLTLDGDRLAATVDGPAGAVIVIYDIAKGEEIARIPVARAE